MIGNFRRRILYPLLAYGRKCTDTEPVKLAKTASAVKASFAGAGVQRAASPLCRGAGAAAHCWGQGVRVAGGNLCGNTAKAPTDAKRRRAHWRVEGGSPIGSRTKCLGGLRAASLIGSRVKRLAQGKLMLASTCTGYYLTQNFAGLAALPPSPAQNIFAGRRKNV